MATRKSSDISSILDTLLLEASPDRYGAAGQVTAVHEAHDSWPSMVAGLIATTASKRSPDADHTKPYRTQRLARGTREQPAYEPSAETLGASALAEDRLRVTHPEPSVIIELAPPPTVQEVERASTAKVRRQRMAKARSFHQESSGLVLVPSVVALLWLAAWISVQMLLPNSLAAELSLVMAVPLAGLSAVALSGALIGVLRLGCTGELLRGLGVVAACVAAAIYGTSISAGLPSIDSAADLAYAARVGLIEQTGLAGSDVALWFFAQTSFVLTAMMSSYLARR